MGRAGENAADTESGEVGNGERLGEALSAAPVGSLGAAGRARGRRLPPHQALQVRPARASHALIGRSERVRRGGKQIKNLRDSG